MFEIRVQSQRSRVVAAPPTEVYALLADVPDSAAHFPSVERLSAEQGGYVWLIEKAGVGRVSLQTCYGCIYTLDPAAPRVSWEAMPGVGNARVKGAWTMAPADGGTRLGFDNDFVLQVELPRILRKVAEGLVEREHARMIDGYLENLAKTFAGGDGRLRAPR